MGRGEDPDSEAKENSRGVFIPKKGKSIAVRHNKGDKGGSFRADKKDRFRLTGGREPLTELANSKGRPAEGTGGGKEGVDKVLFNRERGRESGARVMRTKRK